MMSEDLKRQIRRGYGEAALAVQDSGTSCGGPSCCVSDSESLKVDLTEGNYSARELGVLPETATPASLGCGNPVALATLSRGKTI